MNNIQGALAGEDYAWSSSCRQQWKYHIKTLDLQHCLASAQLGSAAHVLAIEKHPETQLYLESTVQNC